MWVKVKGHIGQGKVVIPNKGRWAHINVKLLHFFLFLSELCNQTFDNQENKHIHMLNTRRQLTVETVTQKGYNPVGR